MAGLEPARPKASDFESSMPKELLEAVSNYFWDVSESANPTISKNDSIKNLLLYRDKLKSHYNSEFYYLFLVGLKYPNEAPNFFTFDSDLKEQISKSDIDAGDLHKLYKSICDHYSYVYIPVESSTQNILKLEYNDVRPHSSLNYQAPSEYAKKVA